MKLKYLLPIVLIIATLFTSCKEDEIDQEDPVSETEGLTIAHEFDTADHTVEVYSKSGKFYTGYNDLSIRIKKNSDNTYFKNPTINWMPMMEMMTMNHSCPKSMLTKMDDKDSLFNGYTVFQMTSMDGTGWSLKFIYTIDGVEYMVEEDIIVIQSEKQNVTTFTGTDGIKYILAIAEPTKPEIAINKLKLTLHKMENMMMFPLVKDYTITLDPRMPSMGNHSSPNNTNLTYMADQKMYEGNLSLTMSGYWVLNLELLNENNEILKGETVTDTHIKSSLFLEIEF